MHCALPHSICDLKATQMNVLCSLNQELTLNDFELGLNAAKAFSVQKMKEQLIPI